MTARWDRELGHLLDEVARERGWRIDEVVRARRHTKWRFRKGPLSALVVTSSTPSDRRTVMNVRADARRVMREAEERAR